MKTKLLHYKFKLPLFKSTVWIIVANTIKDGIDYAEDRTSEKILKEEQKKHVDAYTYAYEKVEGGKTYILFFKPSCSPGDIAHESNHLINLVFRWHGHRLSLANDEVECYYLGDVVNRVHNTIKRYKKLNKLK